ncbi:MAG: alpha/beta fold hydrolase [Sphaerochaetaceae bacterium]|nr:alpha/beta fold hydrolase [Sphaerochaetaceae bacterium]
MKKIWLTFTGILCIALAITLVACSTTTESQTTDYNIGPASQADDAKQVSSSVVHTNGSERIDGATEHIGDTSGLYGVWEGTIEAGGASILLQFAIAPDETGDYQAKLTIPQQMTANLPCSSMTIDAEAVTIAFDYLDTSLSLRMDNAQMPQRLTGIYRQGGEYPLTLNKTELDPLTFNRRPQDPISPYPYICEDITFPQMIDQFTMAGTVTRPDDDQKHPAVVLISGSGSQDRNEELMNHRPFLVLADALTRAGYAVLRYDDRGYGLSEGNPLTATTLEIADDASSALDWLKGQPYVDVSRLFAIGHSEGGIIAPILASYRNDLAGIVMLAGTGVPGKTISLYQSKAINMAAGIPEEITDLLNSLSDRMFSIATDTSKTEEQRMAELLDVVQNSPEQVRPMMKAAVAGLPQLFQPWQQTFLTLDPATYLRQVAIPVLVLNGDKDFQVPADLNIPAITRAIEESSHPDYKVIVYENLNHLFQPCKTGMMNEYYQIETTIAPQVIDDIIQWLDNVCGTSN